MKDENIKINIQEELERVKEALKSADILFENDLIKDAMSRLYYFTLHYIKALLLTKDLEPKSREGALSLLMISPSFA